MKSFLMILLMFPISSAFAQERCGNVFLKSENKLSDVVEVREDRQTERKPKDKTDNVLDRAEAYGIRLTEGSADVQTLLRQISFSILNGASPKLTLEKGEMYLAMPLKDGFTLQVEYQGDSRTGALRLWAKEVMLISPSGQQVKMDSRPLTSDGEAFGRQSYVWGREMAQINGANRIVDVKKVEDKEVREWVARKTEESEVSSDSAQKDPAALLNAAQARLPEQDQNRWHGIENVTFPRVIEGRDMRLLEVWIHRLETITRGQLHDFQLGGNLNRLRMRYYLKSNVDFMRNTIKKQAFKYVLLGAIVYAYLNLEQMQKWAEAEGYLETSVELVSGGYLSQSELSILSLFFEGVISHQDTEVMKEALRSKLSSNRPSNSEDFVSHHDLMARLIVAESTHENGKVNVYEMGGAAKNFLPEVARGSVVYNEFQSALQSGVFLVHFEKQQIVTVTIVRKDKEMPQVKTVTVKKSKLPKLFEALLKKATTPLVSEEMGPPASRAN